MCHTIRRILLPGSMERVGRMHRLLTILTCGTLLILLGACNVTGCWIGDCAATAVPTVADAKPSTATVQDREDVKYYRSDEPLRLGIEHFNRGHYGLAERYFRDATEKAPKDVAAWIALAASYDRLARFDLADRAYKMAIRLTGETTAILNNQGYSYMLRCDLGAARREFYQALQPEPYSANTLNILQVTRRNHSMIHLNPG